MNALLMTTVLALGVGGQPAGGKGANAALEGKWVIVYAEEGGRRNNAWEQRQATVSGGVLSYEDVDNKKRSLRLKLGANQTVAVTDGDAKEGAAGARQG